MTRNYSREKRTWAITRRHSSATASTCEISKNTKRRPCQDVRAEGQNLPVLQVAEAQKLYKLLTKAHKFLNKDSLGWVGAVTETTRLGIHPRFSLSKGRSKFLRDERA